MKIAIIGTRGIPNQYGGFEQFAEYLSAALVAAGDTVLVYSSYDHPYQQSEWNGVKIIHRENPEKRLGKIGQFIYDLNCILHCRKQNYDIILQLGYTSSSVWGWLLPRKSSIIATNMDGLEWKRTRYGTPVKKFLKYAEKLAIKYSHHYIADSVGIQKYLAEKYSVQAVFIPYGADLFKNPDSSYLEKYGLREYAYNMLIARLEPENSIEMILDGVTQSGNKDPFLVIGKYDTSYGEYLKNKYRELTNIQFIGGIYDITILNNLRHYSNLYFHGHTVGGTNPSLLEAMASQSLICAHNNIFNSSILGDDAFYFTTSDDISAVIKSEKKAQNSDKIKENETKIITTYTWPNIIEQYRRYFENLLAGNFSIVNS